MVLPYPGRVIWKVLLQVIFIMGRSPAGVNRWEVDTYLRDKEAMGDGRATRCSSAGAFFVSWGGLIMSDMISLLWFSGIWCGFGLLWVAMVAPLTRRLETPCW